MKRSGPPKRKTPLKASVWKRKPTRSRGEFSDAVKAEVRARSRGRCEAETTICRGEAVHFHHRKRRSQGGKGTVENCLHVCSPCHTFIHDHPEMSFNRGWLIRGRGDS